LRKKEAYRVENLASNNLSADLLKAWSLTLSEIDGIREIAAKADIPLFIIIPPYRFQLDDSEHMNQPQKVLKKFADEHKIPVIDLLPDFAYIHQQKKFKDVELFNDENHLSVVGHDLTAEILANPVSDIVNRRH
jgi:lysophospholipase L1-like esterase